MVHSLNPEVSAILSFWETLNLDLKTHRTWKDGNALAGERKKKVVGRSNKSFLKDVQEEMHHDDAFLFEQTRTDTHSFPFFLVDLEAGKALRHFFQYSIENEAVSP